MDRVRYLRLTVAAAVAVALSAAVGMSLVRSSGEKARDQSTTPAEVARETDEQATFAPTGIPRGGSAESSADTPTDRELDEAIEQIQSGTLTVCPSCGAIITGPMIEAWVRVIHNRSGAVRRCMPSKQ